MAEHDSPLGADGPPTPPPQQGPLSRQPPPTAASTSDVLPGPGKTERASAPKGSASRPPQKNPFGRPPPNRPSAPSEPTLLPVPPAPSTLLPNTKWTVDAVVTAHALPAPTAPPSSPLPFLHTLERLKTTPREGWRRFAIPNGESIADHMHRMALMTFLCPASLRAQGADVGKAARMALVHDMAESLVGDITPVDGISKQEKGKREASAIDWLCGRLLGADRAASGEAKGGAGTVGGMVAGGKEMKELWWEYEESKTLTAKFVHDVDKVELVLQMVEYERRGKGMIDLGEFAHVIQRIELPAMREWAADAMREREELWKQFGKEPSEAAIGRTVIEQVRGRDMATKD